MLYLISVYKSYMDKVNEAINSDSLSSLGFFKYVFNFDEENKNSITNMLQYTILSIIPVVITLRLIKHIIPEEDESKGSLEITLESVGQIILIILAIWFTNKMIRYIPTYSGEAYGKFNETNFIIPFIIILATMQTKLGAKLNILIDRVMDLWHGKSNDKAAAQAQQQGGQGQNVVRVTQPFSGQHQPSQADYLDTRQLLPSNPQLSAMPQQMQAQRGPDFNQMYPNNPTQLQGAAQPGMIMEPMAANEGGGWGSVW
jgi:hypothetical protein